MCLQIISFACGSISTGKLYHLELSCVCFVLVFSDVMFLQIISAGYRKKTAGKNRTLKQFFFCMHELLHNLLLMLCVACNILSFGFRTVKC